MTSVFAYVISKVHFMIHTVWAGWGCGPTGVYSMLYDVLAHCTLQTRKKTRLLNLFFCWKPPAILLEDTNIKQIPQIGETALKNYVDGKTECRKEKKM